MLKDVTECVHNSSPTDDKLLSGGELGVKRPAEDEPVEQVPQSTDHSLSYSGVSSKFKVARQQQSSFNSPMTSHTTTTSIDPTPSVTDDSAPTSHYYNVVWCVTSSLSLSLSLSLSPLSLSSLSSLLSVCLS